MTFKTLAELDESLTHVLSAPKDAGVIDRLCYRPGFGERVYSDHLELSVTDGVRGDRWKEHAWLKLPDGSPDPRIQVCILPKRVLDLVWHEGSDVAYPGDTMIVDMDFSEANMPVGTRLSVGSAMIEVSDEPNYGCTKWAARYGKGARTWLGTQENMPLRLRGVLCKIVQDGTVAINDRVRKAVF